MEQPTSDRLFKYLTSALVQLESSGQDIEGTIDKGIPFSIVLGLIPDPTEPPDFIGMLISPCKDGADYNIVSTVTQQVLDSYTDKVFILVGWFPDDNSPETEDLLNLIRITAANYAVPVDVIAAMNAELEGMTIRQPKPKPKRSHLSVVPKRNLH